jgi:hypothetical protein
MSLQDFIATHRDELVQRTRAKVALRPSPQPSVTELEHGVPLFLSQLGEALEQERRSTPPQVPPQGGGILHPEEDAREKSAQAATHNGTHNGNRAANASGPARAPDTNAAIARSARLHGEDLRRLGFTIEQVVRDYGDVCQAVTELALEENAAVTTAEFHTLNRCLDDAIAEAVTSWNEASDRSRPPPPRDSFRDELRAELSTAIAAFEALRTGRVGPSGATALVAGRCLNRMLSLLRDAKRAP